MESNLSCVSSFKEENYLAYIQPHYKESYRLAIYALLCGGREAYEEFLQVEQITHFLSEEEIVFILENAELPVVEDDSEGRRATDEVKPSTYFPTESDEEVPDLDLGWPEVMLEGTDTSISLLFHPPRQNTPTIKEVVRKQIQEARQNLRVRMVQGQQYQCRSGVKFHGGLEQRFILVDCVTVLYGTYSYTWSFEKINLSMVLVVTGQLVCSFDEEFRRLYARSTVPTVLVSGKPTIPYLIETAAVYSPNSSQLSLNQIHSRSMLTHCIKNGPNERFNPTMTRGLSMQDRIHKSHCPDMGNLVRGHSYGGELQKLNSMTRLRMGTKNLGVHVPPERSGPNMRRSGEMLLPNRLSHQHLRHQTRYGADQNLIPFNSETSLHRWKMDMYLNESEKFPDASTDILSPRTSPYSSNTGLNEHQTQLIHNRSKDIKSRIEEMRQKRLSLQEYANLRQSQESLRAMYPNQERHNFMSSLRGLDMRQNMGEFEQRSQGSFNQKEDDKREQILTDVHRSASHQDIKTISDRKAKQVYDWNEPLSRTTSAAEIDIKLNDATLKTSHLQSSGLTIQHPRAMESLTEVPEEKDGSNNRVNCLELAANDKSESKGTKDVPKEMSVLPADSQHQGPALSDPKDGKKSISFAAESSPKMANSTTESKSAEESKRSHAGKGQTQGEEVGLQRKNSMRKVQAVQDEKKTSKKEEKPLQRKASLRLRNTSGSSQPLRAEHSRSQNSLNGISETEKHKSPFPRLSPLRSSKKKATISAGQDHNHVDDEGYTVNQSSKDNACSRYEHLLSTEHIRMRTANVYSSDKDKTSSLSRRESGFPVYQTQSGMDNKLGRFMQRVGSLISKNK
ncbi:uncharacterized protein KZ484_024288 isoform 2-T5 [Pholidichthys leucotaenia]